MLLPTVLPAGDVPELMRSLGPVAATSVTPDEPASADPRMSEPSWIARLLTAVRGGLNPERPQPRPGFGLGGEER
jgi:hypothetical protein